MWGRVVRSLGSTASCRRLCFPAVEVIENEQRKEHSALTNSSEPNCLSGGICSCGGSCSCETSEEHND
jgi:hypothetical protein